MLYLDLDNTIIDTVRRLDKEKELAGKYGLTAEEYMNAIHLVNERHGIGEFTLRKLFSVCNEIHPGLPEELFAEWAEFENVQIFFPDALEFVNAFRAKDLTLLTAGNHDMQNKKIDVHNLRPYFHEILILPSPKAINIDPPPLNSYYIDDAPREIDAMKKLFPHVMCILVREPPPWEKVSVSKYADVYCKDLKEVLTMLKENK